MATLEQQITDLQNVNADLVQAVNAQTQEVGSKMSLIDQRMAQAGQEVTQYLDNAQHLEIKETAFNDATGSVDADGNWHEIATGINGHYIAEVLLTANASGFHAAGIFTVAITFGAGQVHARTAGPGHTVDVECRISGDTYDTKIEIRTTTAANALVASNTNENKLSWKIMTYKVTP